MDNPIKETGSSNRSPAQVGQSATVTACNVTSNRTEKVQTGYSAEYHGVTYHFDSASTLRGFLWNLQRDYLNDRNRRDSTVEVQAPETKWNGSCFDDTVNLNPYCSVTGEESLDDFVNLYLAPPVNPDYTDKIANDEPVFWSETVVEEPFVNASDGEDVYAHFCELHANDKWRAVQ